jgi:glycosyltransferase involved in cell wall biosynthesis
VLHLSRFYHPHVGGTENVVAQMAEAVAQHGVSSRVLTSKRYSDDDGPMPRVPVERLPVVGPDRILVPYGGLGRAVALARSADILHVHDLRFMFEFAIAASRLQGIPLVVSSHGFIFHTPRLGATKELAWRSYYRLLLRQCSVILCESRHDLAACQRVGLANARLWPLPVQVEPYERATPEPADPGALLYFGRIAPNKGLERLVPVLEQAPGSWSLTIAGTGSTRYVGELRSLFGRFGPRVRFTGHVPDDDLPRLVASHACVVLPSRTEGFGLTLVEALATGVPVVASDIPSYREIARGAPAPLVDFDDTRAAVASIQAAVESWDRAAARERARTFSWSAGAYRLAATYRAIANE